MIHLKARLVVWLREQHRVTRLSLVLRTVREHQNQKYTVGALQGFLAEHFTPIRKPVCIENMNLLNCPPFSFAAKVN